MSEFQSNQHFVSVPVPAERVQEVYALLAKPAMVDVTAMPESVAEGGWTAELVRRMYKESAEPMRQMLALLAAADGEEVSTNEIAEQLQLPKGARSVAGMAGAIGRRVVNRYGVEALPWTSRWRHIDPSDETKGTETLIALPKWICEVINDL